MIDLGGNKKLTKQFYNKKTEQVAKKLLGKIFVKRFSDKLIAGIIVETEAYLSQNDKASHSFGGLTKRNKAMFNASGVLYVYQIYGIHFCCNVVTGKENIGEAVLIRAIEPIQNIDVMVANRFGRGNVSQKQILNLTNGPAKLCKAFSISKRENGINLLQDEIYILDSKDIPNNKIAKTTRIGISKSEELPLRFFIKDNLFVSKH
jgi:DNA-3-methyladenine glycosylase